MPPKLARRPVGGGTAGRGTGRGAGRGTAGGRGRGETSETSQATKKQPPKKVGSGPMGDIDLDEGSDAKPVAEQLAVALKANATRVIDLFHNWDTNQDGTVDRAEFHRAMPALGLEVPAKGIDLLFDSWDKDGGGTIEYKELEKILKKPNATIQPALGSLAKRAPQPRQPPAAAPPPVPNKFNAEVFEASCSALRQEIRALEEMERGLRVRLHEAATTALLERERSESVAMEVDSLQSQLEELQGQLGRAKQRRSSTVITSDATQGLKIEFERTIKEQEDQLHQQQEELEKAMEQAELARAREAELLQRCLTSDTQVSLLERQLEERVTDLEARAEAASAAAAKAAENQRREVWAEAAAESRAAAEAEMTLERVRLQEAHKQQLAMAMAEAEAQASREQAAARVGAAALRCEVRLLEDTVVEERIRNRATQTGLEERVGILEAKLAQREAALQQALRELASHPEVHRLTRLVDERTRSEASLRGKLEAQTAATDAWKAKAMAFKEALELAQALRAPGLAPGSTASIGHRTSPTAPTSLNSNGKSASWGRTC